MPAPHLLWFRNDLRIHDHEGLIKASADDAEIVPVYIFDPRQWDTTRFGFEKTGRHRARFLRDGLADLREKLQGLGADLIIRSGKAEAVLLELAQETGADELHFHPEYMDEEKQVEAAVQANMETAGVAMLPYFGAALYHPDDLPNGIEGTQKVFGDFRRSVEKKSEVRELFLTPEELRMPEGIEAGEIPSLKELGVEEPESDERSVLPFKGGETAALARLEHYCRIEGEEPGPLKSYKYTRNGLLGADYSSKFSPWLAQGSLSPREIYWQVKEYEQQVVRNKSTYWLVFELIWRDYFRYWCAKHGNKVFHWEGVYGDGYETAENEEERFAAWAQGNTGIPFVDANMRELNQTGFMSNRGRQNVASFLVKDLKVDWRRGAEYFESLLLDYDVYSNWGNWCYVAGIGADPRKDRYFHVMSQASRYDEKGKYVRQWIPVLEPVEGKEIHYVWKWDAEQRKEAGIEDYPEPIVIPERWSQSKKKKK